MSHEQVLQLRVMQVRTRIRLLLAQQWLCVGLTVGLLASLGLVAATKMLWWTDAIDYIWMLVTAAGIAGAIYGFTRRISPMVAAQIADDRGGLKERLSTAIELAGRTERSEIAEAQLADAARHAGELSASSVLPWSMPRQWRYLAAAAAVLLAVIYVPKLSLFQKRQDRLDAEVMAANGAKLQQVAKELEKKLEKKKDDKNAEILRRIAQEMKQLGKDQAKGRIPKKMAMLKMNELQKQLKDQAEKAANGGQAQKSLDKAAEEMQQAANKAQQQGDREKAQQLQRMAENLSKKDFEGAKRQLEELARKMQEGKMSAEEAGKAAETLQQMADSMKGSGLDKASQQMKEAADKLKQAADAAKKLQQQMANAKSDAERQQLQQQAQQQLSQAMQQAGNKTHQAGGT